LDEKFFGFSLRSVHTKVFNDSEALGWIFNPAHPNGENKGEILRHHLRERLMQWSRPSV